jgi:hypothetical protein
MPVWLIVQVLNPPLAIEASAVVWQTLHSSVVAIWDADFATTPTALPP